MAMLSYPSDPRPSPGQPPFSQMWWQFFSAVLRKLNAGASVASVTTIDAVDPATTQALVNELKAKVNSLIEAQNA